MDYERFFPYALHDIQTMPNNALLYVLNRHRTAVEHGTAFPTDVTVMRANLAMLNAEYDERVKLRTIVVAPQQPQQPVYAPQTTTVREMQRRLGDLELKAARSGNSTPPEINIEIEDIREILRRIGG